MSEAPTPLPRRLLAEALGTAILVATVVGSGIMAERLAGGNDAIALLGNTIPTGAILVVIITILGPVSGAHFNPAVTLVFATRGETPWNEVIPYVVVQCLAGIAGTVLAHLMFDLAPLAVGIKPRAGSIAMAGRGGRHFHAGVGDPRGLAPCAASGAVAGRLDDHRRLLVYRVDFLCQSGGHHRARLHHDVFRYRDQSCSRLYRRAAHRRRGGRQRCAGAFSVAPPLVRGRDGARRVAAAKIKMPGNGPGIFFVTARSLAA